MNLSIKPRNCLFSILIFLFFIFSLTTHLFAAPSQTKWYVAGAGAKIAGNDLNPGTADKPLASIHRALSLINAAFASSPFDTAVINIEGTVTNYGNEKGVFGMITIQDSWGEAFIWRKAALQCQAVS